MVRPLVALALCALPACGSATLADFSASQLTLREVSGGRVVVELSNPRGDCATLGSAVKATLNGRAMAMDFAGGEAGSDEGWTCRAVQFSLAASGLSSDAVVVLEDGSATLRLEARNFFAQRGLVADRFDDNGGAGHKTLTFRWIPESDAHRTASWRLQGRSGAQFGEARVDSDRISVDLPEQAAQDASLRMDGRAKAPVVRCEGVAGCAATVRASTGDLAL